MTYLTLWHIQSGIPITWCDAQNAKKWVQPTAYHRLYYAAPT